MPSPEPMSPEQQAILGALQRVERRLRLNRLIHTAGLIAGLALLGLVAWRTLIWLGPAAPAARALAILLTTVAAIALALRIGQRLIARPPGAARAAHEADAHAGLHDTLRSAHWFMHATDAQAGAGAREWIAAQARQAAARAATLQPARIVPLRVPALVASGLAAGLAVLAVTWSAPRPATPARAPAAADLLTGPQSAELRALRELAAALPGSEAARRLAQALDVLESGAGGEERRRALAQAQDAVNQLRLDAAAGREGLRKVGQMLAGQPGLEGLAEALARGDAERAAELLARIQPDQAAAAAAADEPADVAGERSRDPVVQQAIDAITEAQGARPGAETVQLSVERLKEIARELQTASYVNEAWQRVQGPQLQADAAGRAELGGFGEQDESAAPSPPSPGASQTPIGGGTRLRTAAMAQGPGLEQSDGGTRMGEVIGNAPPDPLLGEAGERLEAQLREDALAGGEAQGADVDSAWFYAESVRRDVRAQWQAVNARARFAQAQTGAAEGIRIQHRRAVQEFFQHRREGGQAAR
jgi:hypothetical protein